MATTYATPIQHISIHDYDDRTYWVSDTGAKLYIEGDYSDGDVYYNGRVLYYQRTDEGKVQIGQYGEDEILTEFDDTERGWAEFADSVFTDRIAV